MEETIQATPRQQRRFAAALAVVAAFGALGWVWYDARDRIGATQEELARRLRSIETESREARLLARQAQEAVRDSQAKLAILENRVGESQNQMVALEALYQELTRSRDEWALAEVEQVLTLAAQQLQLSGNVRGTLLALQLVETRLGRSDRPQFIPLRKALARDIERLRALPALDVSGISLRLDGVIASVDSLPLAFDERAPADAARDGARIEDGGTLARLGAELWGELKSLVRIRTMDAPEPPLLAPAHAYFLRENLKLRLLNARLSMLARDQAGYREDLRIAQAWITRYFDARAKPNANAQAQLKQLAQAVVSIELPVLAESLEAVRAFNMRRERGN
ncbi:MAG: uroporphyrinogen-III C-methyltransferase [Betaproteobacteria bacterium]|nr:uroporphyrinogen-III C-methyltransferase [Betaproteobacteria bacterium]